MATSRGDLREVFSTLDALRGQRDGLTSKCDRLERDLAARDSEVGRLTADNAAQRSKCARLAEDLHTRDAQLAQATALLHVAQASLRELSVQYDRLRSEAAENAASSLANATQQASPQLLTSGGTRRGSVAVAPLPHPGSSDRASLAQWPRAATELQSSLHELRRNDVKLQQTRLLVKDMRGEAQALEDEAAGLRAQLRRQAASAVAVTLATTLSRRARVGARQAFDGLLMHARQAWTIEAARAQASLQLRALQARSEGAQQAATASRAVLAWLSWATRSRAACRERQRAASAVERSRCAAVLRALRGAVERRRTLERFAAVAERAFRRHALSAWRINVGASARGESAGGRRRLEQQLDRACAVLGRRRGLREAVTTWRYISSAQRVKGMRLRVRGAYATVEAAIELAAARRNTRRVVSALKAAMQDRRRRHSILERMMRRIAAGHIRVAWASWRAQVASVAVESAQHIVAEYAIANRTSHRRLRSHWLAWVGIWARGRRLMRASALVPEITLRCNGKRCLRLWRSCAAAKAAATARQRAADAALLLLQRRRCLELRLAIDGAVAVAAGADTPAAGARPPLRETCAQRCLVRAWICWKGASCERRRAQTRLQGTARALTRAAATAARATCRAAMHTWFANARCAAVAEVRSVSAALLSRRECDVRGDICAVLRVLGKWRRLAGRSAAKSRATRLGAYLERRSAAHARGRALRAWAALWRAQVTSRTHSVAADAAQETTQAMRRQHGAQALATAVAKWGALSCRLGGRAVRRARAAAALQTVLGSAALRRSDSDTAAVSCKWAFSRWAQVLLAGQASAALAAQQSRSLDELRALHASLRLCLRASVAGTSARSLCIAVSSLGAHPAVMGALGSCRIVLWLVDAEKHSLKTAAAEASGFGNSSVGGGGKSGGAGSGMVEATLGGSGGLAGAAAAHFLGLSALVEEEADDSGAPRAVSAGGRSLLRSADGGVMGVAVADAFRDSAYDSAFDGPLRSLCDDAAAAPWGSVAALLLPCVSEGSSGSVAGASRSGRSHDRRSPPGPRLIGVLVIGLATPRGAVGATAPVPGPHALYVADVLAAACAGGVARVLAHAHARHVEVAATSAVQRAHKQLLDTASLVRGGGALWRELPAPCCERHCFYYSSTACSLLCRWQRRRRTARASSAL